MDEVSRQRIEEVVYNLINVGEFESIFQELPRDEKDGDIQILEG